MINDVPLNRRFLQIEDEEEACHLLFTAYYKPVYQVVTRMLGNYPDPALDADDIISETFTKAFSKRKSIRDPEKLAEWLVVVANNIITDKYRKLLARRQGYSVDSLSHIENGTTFASLRAAADAEALEHIRYCLDRLLRLLENTDRDMMELKRDDFSIKQIADQLGASDEAIQKRWERVIVWLGPVALHLDDLLIFLPDMTQQKVMERHLDGQSLSEIGTALSISTACADKHIKKVIKCWKRAVKTNSVDPVSAMLDARSEGNDTT